MPDHYDILNVRRDADSSQVRASFRSLIARWHPDVSATTEAHERAAAIIEAYRTLSDPDRRTAYDRRQYGAKPYAGIERRCGNRRVASRVAPRSIAPLTYGWGIVATIIITAIAAPELTYRNDQARQIEEIIARQQ